MALSTDTRPGNRTISDLGASSCPDKWLTVHRSKLPESGPTKVTHPWERNNPQEYSSGQTGRHKAAQGYGARQDKFLLLGRISFFETAHSGSAQRSVTNHMEYVDRLLICADCNEGFVFSAGEQLFFSDKQFRNDPRRCKACRINRIDKKGAARQGPSSRRTETRAICSQCEVETIVPFRPTNRRPCSAANVSSLSNPPPSPQWAS